MDRRLAPAGFVVEEEAVLNANDEVLAALTLENATYHQRKSRRYEELVEQFGEHDKDFGNSAVQIAVLTERIFSLSHHLRMHRTDKKAYYQLTLQLNRRRKMA